MADLRSSSFYATNLNDMPLALMNMIQAVRLYCFVFELMVYIFACLRCIAREVEKEFVVFEFHLEVWCRVRPYSDSINLLPSYAKCNGNAETVFVFIKLMETNEFTIVLENQIDGRF